MKRGLSQDVAPRPDLISLSLPPSPSRSKTPPLVQVIGDV
jgi:hypothetical protein